MKGVITTGTIVDEFVKMNERWIEETHGDRISSMLKDVFPAQPSHRLKVSLMNQKEQSHLGLIAEIKRASPAHGELNSHIDIVKQAKLYMTSGATAISVVTQPHLFSGSFDDLRAVAEAVSLPVLCKEFIIHPAQIYHARRCGAASVLLIATILEEHLLKALVGVAESLGMDAVVEAHTPGEVTKALSSGAKIVGINARDLKTMMIDLSVCTRLLPMIPPYILRIAESGIETYSDAEMMKQAGADALLVGTVLMQRGNTAEKIRELMYGPEI